MDSADRDDAKAYDAEPGATPSGNSRTRSSRMRAAVHSAQAILAEAAHALNDRTRGMQQTEIPEVMGATFGAGLGVAASLGIFGLAAGEATGAAAITTGLAGAGAIVGGGMAAGVAVLSAPIAILGIGGFWAVSRYKKVRNRERYQAELQEAMRMRDAIINELRTRGEANSQRLEYLQQVLNQLSLLIDGLRSNLNKQLPA